VQHAGIDEGGIVKLHGDHLVILRRGRLFTVSVGDAELKPVAAVDAFGPGIEPRGTWYDEMLIARDTVVVIGYSHARGGTEIGLFEINPKGELHYKATYHLRSNDYYSSRNYSSRLIGTKLIFGQESENEAKAALELLGLDPNDHALVQRLRTWATDKTIHGRCLMRDLDDRIAEVQIDLVYQHLLDAFNTRPPREHHEQAPVEVAR